MLSAKLVNIDYDSVTPDSYHFPAQLPQSPPPTPIHKLAAPLTIQATERIPSGCKVSQCRIVACRLVSHAHFRPAEHQNSRERNRRHDISRIRVQRLRANRSTRRPSDSCDGDLSSLGLGESLHHLFTDTFEPAARNFRQAFATILPGHRFSTIDVVLNSEPFCAALTLSAYTKNAAACQYYVEVRTAMLLYNKALAGFRNMLIIIQNSPDPEQIELALIIISILLSYDALYAKFHELMLHRAGMQNLVQLRGGLDRLTVSLPYVLHFDRIAATILNLPPAFSHPVTPELRPHHPSWPVYGGKFAQMRQQLRSRFSQKILDHCERTSNLIQKCESLSPDQTFSSEDGCTNSYTNIEYFCSERDKVDEDFATIHGLIFDEQSIDKCVLWASRIVEYPATWSNYCPTYTGLLFKKLHECIQAPELGDQWSEHTDVFVWVLFVMVISLTSFEGRPQVLQCLREMISAKYGTQTWPKYWWEEELANLRGFVWCDSYYEHRYDALCKELEGDFLL